MMSETLRSQERPRTRPLAVHSDVSATPRAIFRGAVRDFRRAMPDLFAYDVLFGSIAFAVLTPLVSWSFRRLVATSGETAIGNVDIARFLLTPSGLAMSAVAAVLICAISFGRFAGLMHIGHGAAANRRITALDAFRFVMAGRFPRILGASFLVLFILAAAALPFLLGGLLATTALLTQHDINYYLDARPPEFWLSAFIGAGLAIVAAVAMALVSVPLIFVLPHALFNDTSVRSAFRDSRRLARSVGAGPIAGCILIWLATWSVASLLLNAAIHFVGRALVQASGDNLAVLLTVLGGIAAVSLTVNFLISFAAVSIGCLLIMHLFCQAYWQCGLEIPAPGEHGSTWGDKPRRPLSNKRPLGIAVVLLILTAFVAHQVLESLRMEDHVEISAHRGASLAAPENTLSAVRRAIADGATHVEIDVQRTADGALVVNHDADLMRVAGVPLVISESTLEEIRTVDVGRARGPEFAGERVPTLDEVIDATNGKATLIVELKSYKADSSLLVADVVRTLRRRGVTSGALIMSLEYSEVEEARHLAPEIECGYVASAALGDMSRLNADFLAVSQRQATDAFVGAAHAQGKKVYVWTVDDPREMFALIDRGVDNIITNDPAAAVSVLTQRASLGNAERILLKFRSLYAG